MKSRLLDLFEDEALRARIQKKLPRLFQMAEIESKRGGGTGMEVGNLREKILIALLIHKFGEKNVDAGVSTTAPGVDTRLFGDPVGIKTITVRAIRSSGGVKVSWTVDPQKARQFAENYAPTCDTLLAQIVWKGKGGLFLLPVEAQQEVFATMGREKFLKLPKPGTNPRGVEWSSDALRQLLHHPGARSIEIFWELSQIEYNAYQRWLDYWEED